MPDHLNMNSNLELHDSTLSAFTVSHATLELLLEPAIVHISGGVPGVDLGTVWLQNFRVVLGGAKVPKFGPALPIKISDGLLVAGRRRYRNVVPIVWQTGPIRLWLTLVNGVQVQVSAETLDVVAVGERRYLETFQGT